MILQLLRLEPAPVVVFRQKVVLPMLLAIDSLKWMLVLCKQHTNSNSLHSVIFVRFYF
jgi:hypothetical protein